MSIYNINVKKADGSTVSLSDYKGKMLLIVNTASLCGYTPQLSELEDMYLKYKDKGFEVLAFPSNQFLNQEPDSIDKVIQNYKEKYGVTFPIFDKIDVRGENIDPLFAYLIGQKGYDKNTARPADNMKELYAKMDANWESSPDIKWNFTKFLVDREGNVVTRFEPEYKPNSFDSVIEKNVN